MKSKYKIMIYWSDEDNSFIAEAPELAGCMADGETYLEAVGNIQTVTQEWVEIAKELGREIPKPKGKLMYA
jgi:predicted RNase H-like HicB family nuclease